MGGEGVMSLKTPGQKSLKEKKEYFLAFLMTHRFAIAQRSFDIHVTCHKTTRTNSDRSEEEEAAKTFQETPTHFALSFVPFSEPPITSLTA